MSIEDAAGILENQAARLGAWIRLMCSNDLLQREADSRSPDTSATSCVGFTMATVVYNQELFFILMEILKVVQFRL